MIFGSDEAACGRRPAWRLALCGAALVVATLAAQPGQAAIADAAGDFLPTFIGPRGGDLDVLSVSATRSGPDAVILAGTHAAAIGSTDGTAYIWGINRGAGIEPFPTFEPPVGEGVFFDSYVTLLANGTGSLTDLLAGTVRSLDPATITIAGSTISVRLTSSLLPTRGFAFVDYLYNLWPRYAPAGVEPGSNTQISDFAPDARSFAASVPEPGTWMMMIGGFGLIGLRRRKLASVAA